MEWYTIGEVSKLCNIPIRTLRYYDDIGLLKPEKISPETNYRYYSMEGIRKIPLIKYYKQLGFKLDDIREMLERPNFKKLEDYMSKELLIVEQQMAELQKKHFAIKEWQQLLEQGETFLANPLDESNITITRFPRLRTLKFRYEKEQRKELDIEVIYSNMLVELCNRNNIYAYGPFMLYFDNINQRIAHSFTGVDCFTAVIEDEASEALTTSMGGYEAVRVVHKGDHRTIADSYSKVQNWAIQRGIELQGDSYERYIIDPWSTADSSNYITDLIFPIGGDVHV
jgi:DNA-binding transcriptional MerR regulator